jgi:hypothetical protein
MSSLPYDVDRLARGCEGVLTEAICNLERFYTRNKKTMPIIEVLESENVKPQIREMRYRSLIPKVSDAVKATEKEIKCYPFETRSRLKDRLRDGILKNKIRDALTEEAISFLRGWYKKPNDMVVHLSFNDAEFDRAIEQSKVFHCCV